MSKFKYIGEPAQNEDCYPNECVSLTEIAYQLKRIADKLEAKE